MNVQVDKKFLYHIDYELLIPKKELQTLVLNEMKLAEIPNDNAEKNK